MSHFLHTLLERSAHSADHLRPRLLSRFESAPAHQAPRLRPGDGNPAAEKTGEEETPAAWPSPASPSQPALNPAPQDIPWQPAPVRRLAEQRPTPSPERPPTTAHQVAGHPGDKAEENRSISAPAARPAAAVAPVSPPPATMELDGGHSEPVHIQSSEIAASPVVISEILKPGPVIPIHERPADGEHNTRRRDGEDRTAVVPSFRPRQQPLPIAAPAVEGGEGNVAAADGRRALAPLVPIERPHLVVEQPAPAPERPTVNIRIGRVEVRAVRPPAPSPSPERPTARIMSLDEYLRARAGGRA